MRNILFGLFSIMVLNVSAQQINVKLPQINVSAENRNSIDTVNWDGDKEDADISATVRLTKQKYFEDIPAGNYSGLVRIKNNEYAIVSDKTSSAGYYKIRINIDENGDIDNIVNLGWQEIGGKNHDEEAIAYNPYNQHLYIGNEENSTIDEIADRKIIKTATIEDFAKKGETNRTIESLCFDATERHFYTISESYLRGDERFHLRLKELDENLKEVNEYDYIMDRPEVIDSRPANEHAYGVSELTPLLDGTLLVLEREFYVAKMKIGSWVHNKIYRIKPGNKHKQLVADWRTKINLTNRSLANYEGMCLGPKLKNGKRVIILCADSQDQYKGVLKDWFRTIVL